MWQRTFGGAIPAGSLFAMLQRLGWNDDCSLLGYISLRFFNWDEDLSFSLVSEHAPRDKDIVFLFLRADTLVRLP